MFPDKRVEYKLYLAGLVFAAVSAAGIAVLVFTPFKIPGCTFKSVTGLYCPGCGGTRAVAAFIQGHWARSFRYHPFVPYCGILYIIFMTKGTLALFSKEKFPYMKFRNGYIYFGIVILLVQFVIKDIMLLVYGVDVLGIV